MALNVIKVQVSPGQHKIWTDNLVQWDYGQILEFEGIELPYTFKVEFSNEPVRGTAKGQVGINNRVLVPYEYMKSGDTVYSWIVLYEGEEDRNTEYFITSPVTKRSKPVDEELNPEERSEIDSLIAAMNEAAKAAANNAEAAAASATDASGSATTASTKAGEAAASATAASGSASSASSSAGAAAGSAAQAAESASNAGTSAQAAASAASSAGQSATTATEKAGEAAQSTTTATEKAGEAAQSATTATEKAGEAAQSATNAARSAEGASSKAAEATESANAAASAKNAIKEIAKNIPNIQGRVSSLTDTGLFSESVIEAAGIPVYVEDISDYYAYGIEDTGWYVFCRIKTKDGEPVTNEISIEGDDGHIAVIGEDHIDVAVRFEVAAISKKVIVDWGTSIEIFVFKATDLAVRNLDYRVTFYVYDIDEFITWEYTPATDSTFAAGKAYYTKRDGIYSETEVTEGDTVPVAYYVDEYELTSDVEFAEGTTYYTKDGTAYTAATVTAGEPVPEGTYYVHSYVLTSDVEFAEGTTYYTKDGTAYTAATVTAGEPVPEVIFVHAKARIEGMTRNITYRCNTTIDCPVEFVLPAIEDDCHGCWYELRFRHAGTYSITLIPTDPDIKVATEHTQAETAGINMVNLHYTSVDGVKIWRFMNTHSTIPA